MKSRWSPNLEREAKLFGSLFGLGDPGAGALGGRRICIVFDYHVVEPESLVFQAHIFEADTESVERSGVEAEPGIFVEYPAVARGGGTTVWPADLATSRLAAGGPGSSA